MWVVTHSQMPHPELKAMCDRLNIPLFSTTLHTYEFNKIAQRILEEFFAPHAIIHGSLVDVYGVGMLYVGDSNVGKSECVLDLVESGHRMVADDVVHISNVGRSIIGRPDPLIKHHMEIRGVGILDIRAMFGIHAIRKVKKIETIVELQQWHRDGGYDRTGLNEQEEEVMGIKIPKVVIPVAPGKNLTVISEVIAMNTLMKYSGQNVAQDFNESLMQKIKAKAKGEYVDDLLDFDNQNWSYYE
jgi:HPr kinase/phosphorylase